MNDREFKELLYRKRLTDSTTFVDLVRDQLCKANLLCYETDEHFHYDHWEDATVDDPWEGPSGMNYGFYVRAQGFHLWCGFMFSEPSSRKAERHSAPDTIRLRFYEKPDVFHVSIFPPSIPEEQQHYEITFDESAEAALRKTRFKYMKKIRQWEKLYRISDFSDPQVLAVALIEDIQKIAGLSCSIIHRSKRL